MAYIKKEEMDKFIKIMFDNGLTPLMLVGPYMEEKYRRRDRDPNLQTASQMMKTLGVSESTLYRYMDEGLPFQYKEEGRGRLFDKQLCLAYLRQRDAVKKKGAKIKRDGL